MKNPLNKRLPRELKNDLGKYLVIFLFMVLLIGLVSGFLVADGSMIKAYNEGFTKYNLEDGHFALNIEAPEELIKNLEDKAGISIYDLRYFEEEIEGTTKNVRVYIDREQVNLECVMDGAMPADTDEIAIDRMFADNNKLECGDKITLNGHELTITALIAVPDYSCLYENNSDMMFDSINFTIAVMTKEGFESVGSSHITYNYAWKYSEEVDREDFIRAKELSDRLLDNFGDVIEEYDKGIAAEAIDSIKLVMLTEFKEQAEKEGYDLSSFDNLIGYKLALKMINEQLEEEGVSLKEVLGTEEEVELSTADIKRVFRASDEEVSKAREEVDTLESRMIEPTDYLPRYLNSAINFTGEDMGTDRIMFVVFGYLVIIILAFIFAVTISNTIVAEAGVIGTLRASGYTRGEIIRHYMVLPVLVTLVAGVVGNILGYTVFKDILSAFYYGSYSLPTFVVVWSAEAFLMTTVVPIILMFVINLAMLVSKLKLSPLRFLRRDISKRGKKKAFRLNTKIPFVNRFRMRILFQNIPNYAVLLCGIFLGAVLVVFSLMFSPMLDDFGKLILETKICSYQYVLMEQKEVTDPQAEKYAIEGLKTMDERYKIDDISIYGIVEDSHYITKDIPEGQVLVSNGFAAKFKLSEGDKFTLKDPYSSKTYELTVAGEYNYDAALSVFMNLAEFNEMFGNSEDYFAGYFSNTDLSDELDAKDIAAVITEQDLTKVSAQLKLSMGRIMGLLQVFGVAMFLLIMYTLSKQIIEKNAKSISIVKILGFSDGEIGGLYIVATSVVVIFGLLITIPFCDIVLRWIFSDILYMEMTGYIPYIVSNMIYVKMFLMGAVSYAVVAALQLIKIGRVPKSDALKMVE